MSEPNPDAKAIFFEAIQKSTPDELGIYLDQACRENDKLRERVEDLLRAHQKAGNFLGGSSPVGETVDLPQITEQLGREIGPYKLLQQIGEGGMGVVYMAEQKSPVKRRVALKIVKPGMGSRDVIARFEAERQALAMMDHPNIAKVLDVGTTDGGHPYFVMELVKGVPITKYCDENHLTPRERLELFIPTCQAIQHAHQKGIIHRDIKPSNILVAEYDHQAVPKIIDFGVAKALNAQLTDKTMFTQLGQIIGTIEYMSPEQAKVNQMDVDTRSDIYSLGVVLYELLAGATPFDKKRLRSVALDELMRIIREEEPPRPSTRLSTIDTLPSIAANRRTEPKKLSVLLHGELDWIVMKALDKDRGRRYETANGFANDIKRYLNDDAVVACPPSAGYKFKKFARRNKVALFTSGIVAAALVIGIVGTTSQAIRATNNAIRATEAEQQANLNFENEKLARLDADAAREEEQKQREQADNARNEAELAREKEVTAREDAETARDQAETEATRAKTVVGVLTELFASANFDDERAKPVDFTMSQMLFQFAERLPKQLEEFPEIEAEVRSIIGRAFSNYTFLAMADRQISRSHQLRREIYGEDHPKFADSLLDYHDLHQSYGNFQEAKKMARQAHTLAQEFPEEIVLRLRSLRAVMQMESWQRQIELGERALELARDHGAESNPDAAEIFRFYIKARLKHATAISTDSKPEEHAKKLNEVEVLARQAVKENRTRFGNDHIRTWRSLRELGHVKKAQGDTKEAEIAYRQALDMSSRQLQNYGGAVLFHDLRPMIDDSQLQELLDKYPLASQVYWERLAYQQLQNKNVEEFRKTCQIMLEKCRYPQSFSDYSPEYVSWAASYSPKSFDDWSPAIKLLRRYHTDHPDSYEADFALGTLLFRGGQYDEAIEFLLKAEHKFATSFPSYIDHTYVVCYRWNTWLFLAMAHHKTGNKDEASRWFVKAAVEIPRLFKGNEFRALGWDYTTRLFRDEAQEMLQIDPIDIQPTNAWSYIARAEVYQSRGQIEEAIADYKKAAELEPNSASIHRACGEVLREAGHHREAIAEYEKAIELGLNATDLLPYVHRAVCYRDLGEYEQALASLKQAFALQPGSAWAHQHRGEVYRFQGKLEKAIADYNSAEALGDMPTWIMLNRAKCYRDLGKYDEAIADYSRLNELQPGIANRHRDRGLMLLKVFRFDEALEEFNQAINLDPNSLALMYRAVVYVAMGDHKRAQADFDKNLKNSSNKGQAWFNYAYALHTAGMLDEAIEAHKKAAEFDQTKPVATYNLACAYALKNEKDKSFDALNKAIEFGFGEYKLISTDTDLKNVRDDERFDAIVTKIQWGKWYADGIANANKGEFEQAISDLTKAIELNPKYAIAVLQRGQLYQRMGEQEKAADDFDHYTAALDSAVSESPQDWQAVNRRGVAYSNMGNWDAAIDDFARAIELAPDKAVARTNRANCSLNLQQWHKAAEDLVRVIELGEANWQTHYYLGLARLGDGDQTAYHKACRTMLAEFSDTEDPQVANFVAWTCSLGPGALEDWTPAIEMARLAKLKVDSLQNQNTLGTLLMRAGQTEGAIKVLTNVTGLLNNPSSSGNASPAYTWYALALACHGAGQTEEAKEWFEKANRWTEKAFNEDESQGGAKLAWNRRLTLQLLRDQASAIINDASKSGLEKNSNDTNQSQHKLQSTDSEK